MRTSPSSRSEQQFQRELHDACVARLRDRAECRAHVAAVRAGDERHIRSEQVDVIDEIERFGAELQLPVLLDLRVLDQRQIEVVRTRPTDVAYQPREIAVGEIRRIHELRRIEPAGG